MSLRSEVARAGLLAVLVFAGLTAVEVMLLVISTGYLPNAVTAPIVEQFAFLVTLWNSNPSAALPLIAQQPMLLIAHSASPGGVPIWGIYYFPLSFLVHVALALLAAWSWRRGAGHRRELGLLVAGGVALAFAVSAIRLSSCCTGGPRWVLEVWLLALAFDPTRTLLDWSAVIVSLEPFFPSMQLAIGLTGIALLMAAVWRRHQASQAK
ncbi:MAG TPA: hypothetical protein DIC36_06260 [Gammaproteobacteria bacterium]|nr:hypothetical protein [Gammaproteobacteria bacterium]